jgi:hypothetical protein
LGYLSFCVEALFDFLPAITREQRYFCSTQLRRNPVRNMSVDLRTTLRAGIDSKDATINQQLQIAEELVAIRDRAVQDGSKWDPAMRAVRDSVEKVVPRELMNARVSELDAAKSQGLTYSPNVYRHARKVSQRLRKFLPASSCLLHFLRSGG